MAGGSELEMGSLWGLACLPLYGWLNTKLTSVLKLNHFHLNMLALLKFISTR